MFIEGWVGWAGDGGDRAEGRSTGWLDLLFDLRNAGATRICTVGRWARGALAPESSSIVVRGLLALLQERHMSQGRMEEEMDDYMRKSRPGIDPPNPTPRSPHADPPMKHKKKVYIRYAT